MGRSHLDPFLADFDASGNVTAVHLHADAVDALLASVTPSGGVSWYLTDNQGSVRSVLNAAGSVVDRITYDAFGGVAAETNPSAGGRFKYTSREWDGEIGLQYNRARYYDPSTGRWISQDPIGFAGGDANLYRYVGNSPTNATDPSGLKYQATGANGELPPASTGSSNNGFGASDGRYWGQSLVEGAQWTWDVGSAFTSELGNGLYNVATGVGHTAYDVVAAPVDFVGFEAAWATGGTWKAQSYLGEGLEQAFDNGDSLGSVLWNAEKNVATLGMWGLAESGIDYASTGDPTQFQQSSGGVLAGMLALKYQAKTPQTRSPYAPVSSAEWNSVFQARYGAKNVLWKGGAADPVAGTPPRVNPGFPAAGRNQNCANCALATEATFSGHPASALPTAGPRSLAVIEQATGGRFIGGFSRRGDIERALSSLGPGARGIVFGERAGGVGHVFNCVVNNRGVVKFFDGQTGRAASFVGYTGFRLLITAPR